MTRDRDDDAARFLAHRPHSLGLPTLFYGSLQAPEVFAAIVGASLDSMRVETVQIAGHWTATVMPGGNFPGIFPDPEASLLTCLLVHGLSLEQRLRVAWYEWDEYRIDRFTLVDGRAAEAFVPHIETIERLHGPVNFEAWRYADWRSGHLEDALSGTAAWMAAMPDIAPLLAKA